MASFHRLLQQLVDAHEADLAQLREKVEELQAELDCSECSVPDVEVASPVRRLWALQGEHSAPPAFPGEEGFEPVIKIFGMEVKQLGLRVQWNTERPIVQRVVQGTAAAEGGVRPGDMLLAINGAETFGRAREELLACLQQRPLTLELLRRAEGDKGTVNFGTPQASLYHLQSSCSNLGQPQNAPASPLRRSNKVILEAVKEDSAKQQGDPRVLFHSEEEEKLPSNTSKKTLTSSWEPGGRSPKRGRSPQAEKGSEGTQTYLGLRRFITARKDSTPSVAHLGIGNFQLSFHEDHSNPRLSLNRLFHMFVKWLSHIREPERSGCAYQVLESRCFSSLCSFIILMHAVVVTMSFDWEVQNPSDKPPDSYHYMELVFLGFYAVELALRLYVHQCFFFFGEAAGWNWFDFFLVAFSFVDVVYLLMQMTTADSTGGSVVPEGNAAGGNVSWMRLFRLFKITKILRTIRIFKVFRELSLMMESFTKCIVAMFWGLVLLVFLLYIFALVFVSGITEVLQDHELNTQQLEDVESQFGSVLRSMLSLYMAVTGGNDWSMYYDTVSMGGPLYIILFLLFNFFFVFALFNIMTGVFVERALTAAIPDRDELIWEQQKKLAKQVEDFKLLCNEFDTDGSGKITREEFRNHMRNDTMVSYMASVGLELHDVEHFFRTVAGEDQEVSIDRFVEGCMAMRGHATALDVQRQLFESKRLEDNLNAFRKEARESWSKVQKLLHRACKSEEIRS